jgi:hypothetical protein
MTQTTARQATPTKIPDKIVLRAWPKMLFMWPSALGALVAGLMTYLYPENIARMEFWGALFLVVFAINFLIITFEFPRSTSLILVLALVAVTWILVELNRRYQIIVPLTDFVDNLHLTATADFYFALFAIYAILYVGMFISTRFNYWVISSNELLHHKGMMQDVERFSTDGLQYSKEITDFFEYLIAGSGRLSLRSPSIEHSITLDNVLRINIVARNLDTMLEYRRVAVNPVPVQPVVQMESNEISA